MTITIIIFNLLNYSRW